MIKNRLFSVLALLGLLVSTLTFGPNRSYAADDSRTFPETGKTVSGTFLDYWNEHGGLAQQGFPISEETQEQSDTDGKTYTVQYFERAVFEKHPENAAPYDVLLSLLGVTFYDENYGGKAPGQKASTINPRKFSETGKTIGGAFRTYWERNGGLAQQGYPISDEFQEKSATDGKTYTVQYFQRAVFELHPENAGKPGEVLLSLLGRFRLDGKGGGGTTVPAPPSTTAALTVPGWTSVTVSSNNIALFYNAANGDAATARVNADGTLTQLADKTRLGTFRTGWTQIVPGPRNTLFFYNSANGATSLSVTTDDGMVPIQLEYRPYSLDWSIIAMDPASGIIMFYNDKDGTEGLARMLPDGQVAPLVSHPGHLAPGDTRWSNILTVGNGFWFRYSAGTGHVGTFKYADDGSGYGLVPFETSPTWSSVASNGAFLYFYDKTNAKAMTAVVTPETPSSGKFVPLKTYDGLSGEWTNIAGTPNNGPFVIYSSTTGNIATDAITSDGQAKALKRYSPAK